MVSVYLTLDPSIVNVYIVLTAIKNSHRLRSVDFGLKSEIKLKSYFKVRFLDGYTQSASDIYHNNWLGHAAWLQIMASGVWNGCLLALLVLTATWSLVVQNSSGLME